MCKHHWIIDSSDKGICKLCGEQKDFALPIEKFNKKEKVFIKGLGNSDYYMQGHLDKQIEIEYI